LRIGVLGIQGDIQEHLRAINRIGHEPVWVKDVPTLESVDALAMPGGESTTMTKLLKRFGIWDTLRERIVDGLPVFATCAGMILLSEGVENYPAQDTLRVLDVTIERNGYGRQANSFEADLYMNYLGDVPFRAIFIRAPKISSIGEGVEVLANYNGVPVLVRHKSIMAASFHPELTSDFRLHMYFIEAIARLNEEARTEKQDV